MAAFIKLNPEVVRLAQLRARNTGCALKLELARAIVEETLLELDPELGFLLDDGATLNSIDALAAALGANDVIVNEKHIDVRVLEDDDSVTLVRALVGTPYLSLGSLVVKLDDNHSGGVVGYIGPGGWLSAEQEFAKEQSVKLKFEAPDTFDLSATLSELCSRAIVHISVGEKSLPNAEELTTLLTNREKLIVARQKHMVSAIVTNVVTMELAREVSEKLAHRSTRQTLTDASVWTSRVENFADKLAPKFPSLTNEEIRSRVRKTGEIYGGQPDAPAFRHDVLAHLTREQLVRKFAGVPAAKVMGVVDQVLSGRSAVDTVKELVKSKVAVDLASSIKRNRIKMEGFVAASAEEIGAAFKQLAIQPAYATHSTDAEGGIDAINEALQLLEVGDLAEQIRQLDQELTAK